MKIQIDKNSRLPLRDQIKDQIKGLIHAGKLNAGDQLPTIRALAIDLAVNFNTVAQAYYELDLEGVIVTERGRGTFVAQGLGEAEMQQARVDKLEALVKQFFAETQRLGYSDDEVQAAIAVFRNLDL